MATEKQRKTFLSYSRFNKDFAIKLAKELKSEGFDTWLDQLDIPAGSRWDREVEKALKECEIFMIIMTAASVDSENVLDEIGYAIDTGKRLLPVLLENCEVPFRLRRFQYVDFTNKDFDDGVKSAKQLLSGLIAQTTIPRGQVPDDTQAQKKKAELDRKAEEDAERIAKKVADEELASKTMVETEWKAKKEADRLAAQKAEEERVAKAKADTDLLTTQKAEEERLAKQKAETERKAKEVVESRPKPEELPETSPPSTQKKKSLSGGLVAGIVMFVVLCVAGVGLTLNALSNGNTEATNTLGTSPSSIPLPSILAASKAKELKDSSIPANTLAGEQLSDERFSDLFNSQQQIPVTIDVSGGPVYFSLGWCAKTEDILENNIAQMEFPVTFNEKIVSDTQVYRYYYESEGEFCYGSVLMVDDWVKGEYIIMLENVILQRINDGIEDHDPGTFMVQYVVTME